MSTVLEMQQKTLPTMVTICDKPRKLKESKVVLFAQLYWKLKNDQGGKRSVRSPNRCVFSANVLPPWEALNPAGSLAAHVGARSIPGRIQDGYFRPSGLAYQDEVLAFVNIPLETPSSALAQYVEQAVRPLFQVFDGYKLDMDVIEDFTRRLTLDR